MSSENNKPLENTSLEKSSSVNDRPSENAIASENATSSENIASSENDSALGRFLAAQLTPPRLKAWRNLMFGVLALAALLNLVVANHHPHFNVDRYPFFWPVFGLVCGVVMIFLVKKVIQPIIKRTEDHYADL
ncbi:MAG: hypothetical protein LBT62_04360 [Deltaproteobacteria bacterium]|jgi:hypothetical protein|nr:hypothetical protein [Deltaproteobacteria bacterium]